MEIKGLKFKVLGGPITTSVYNSYEVTVQVEEKVFYGRFRDDTDGFNAENLIKRILEHLKEMKIKGLKFKVLGGRITTSVYNSYEVTVQVEEKVFYGRFRDDTDGFNAEVLIKRIFEHLRNV